MADPPSTFMPSWERELLPAGCGRTDGEGENGFAQRDIDEAAALLRRLIADIDAAGL